MLTDLDRTELAQATAMIRTVQSRMENPAAVFLRVAVDVLIQIIDKPSRPTSSIQAMITLAVSAIEKAKGIAEAKPESP